MRPVVTTEEMRAIDAAARQPIEVLIARAGWAVARRALELLVEQRGQAYGSRVLVIAGKGNNGADGISAAATLGRRGVRCRVVPPDDARTPQFGDVDLVIDAAYGTGFRGTYSAPDVGSTPVLAVDIPSGVDGMTGQVSGTALPATATVTFAALKPGLLFEPGRSLAGPVDVVDIGLDCSRARCWHLGAGDLAARWPRPPATTHKWKRAIWIIGGSPGMTGAPALAAAAAARAGAGYVTVSIPGTDLLSTAAPSGGHLPIEAVVRPLPSLASLADAAVGDDLASQVLDGADRIDALVIGPGLAADDRTGETVRAVVAATGDRPVVLDGGALDAVAADPSVLGARVVPAVLTPHEGEFVRLVGHRPGPDRIDAAREAARALSAIIVAKGPTTVVAHPDSRAFISTAGDERLATAGSGDVLAGAIGAGLAAGLDPLDAAALGAELHGRAALGGRRRGFVASDLPPLVADLLDTIDRIGSPGPEADEAARGEATDG